MAKSSELPSSYHNQETETPRTGVDLLAAQNGLRRYLKDNAQKIQPALQALLETSNTPALNLCLRLQIEEGKEESLNYALGRSYDTEKPRGGNIHVEGLVTADDYLQIKDEDKVKKRGHQEIMEAKALVGGFVDILYGETHAMGLRAGVTTKKMRKNLDVALKFSRSVGQLQGINYLLGDDNDGGIASRIEQSRNI